MTTNNSINTQGLATSGEAIAGLITDKLITPATLKAVLDTFATPDLTENIGLFYSAGTLMIRTLSGDDLGVNSPGRLKIPSKAVPGTVIAYTVTANQDLLESDLTGSIFGTSAGIAWNEDKPFYLYAVHNDAETALSFMISAVPNRYKSPVAANIGVPSSAVADTQGSFFAFGSPTVTDYDENNIKLMGSFRMRKNSSDAWTVQAFDEKDGVGVFQPARAFNYPSGQQTAASGEWLRPNGGTAPTFSSNTYQYYTTLDGICAIYVNFSGDGGTAGSGAVNLQLTAPYKSVDSFISSSMAFTFAAVATGSVIDFQNFDYLEFFRSDSGMNKPQNANFTAGARSIYGLANFNISVD